jgi:hypothetical protein
LVLNRLQGGDTLPLFINKGFTTWVRMNPQPNGTPTMGIKLSTGHTVWDPIPLGSECEVEWIKPDVPDPPAGPRTSAAAQVGGPSALTSQRKSSLFDAYFFADYSGAQSLSVQRKAIQAVSGKRGGAEAKLGGWTRDALVGQFIGFLRRATDEGMRVCGGFDHQYSIPIAFVEELGLAGMEWRGILRALIQGGYGLGAPALGETAVFAAAMNDWLQVRGRPPYFWSATKSDLYGIPGMSPDGRDRRELLRLTERARPVRGTGNPKPLCRLGDNGSVGGQTLFGLRYLHEVMEACMREHIPLKVWPFDGLSIDDYKGFHVLVEPYPAVGVHMGSPKSDINDARAALRLVQGADETGELRKLLDLSALSERERAVVLVEGWIVGYLPPVLDL